MSFLNNFIPLQSIPQHLKNCLFLPVFLSSLIFFKSNFNLMHLLHIPKVPSSSLAFELLVRCIPSTDLHWPTDLNRKLSLKFTHINSLSFEYFPLYIGSLWCWASVSFDKEPLQINSMLLDSSLSISNLTFFFFFFYSYYCFFKWEEPKPEEFKVELVFFISKLESDEF